MILLALAIVLLLTGSGEAGEQQCYLRGDLVPCSGDWDLRVGPNGTDRIKALKFTKIVNDEHGVLVTCNEANTKCWTPCEQRMREAMRAMDAAAFNPDGKSLRSFTNKESDPQVFLTIETERLWKKTMHDCVKETP
jgi:hypothetical protein